MICVGKEKSKDFPGWPDEAGDEAAKLAEGDHPLLYNFLPSSFPSDLAQSMLVTRPENNLHSTCFIKRPYGGQWQAAPFPKDNPTTQHSNRSRSRLHSDSGFEVLPSPDEDLDSCLRRDQM